MSSPDNVNWSLSNFLESIRPGYASLYFETLTELGVDDPMELEAVTVDLLLELSVKKLHAIRIHKACLAYTKDSEENIASKDFVVSSMVVASNPSSTTSIVSSSGSATNDSKDVGAAPTKTQPPTPAPAPPQPPQTIAPSTISSQKVPPPPVSLTAMVAATEDETKTLPLAVMLGTNTNDQSKDDVVEPIVEPVVEPIVEPVVELIVEPVVAATKDETKTPSLAVTLDTNTNTNIQSKDTTTSSVVKPVVHLLSSSSNDTDSDSDSDSDSESDSDTRLKTETDVSKKFGEDWSWASNKFEVGQSVECRDKNESWSPGKIKKLNPLKIQKDSWSDDGEGYSWKEVRVSNTTSDRKCTKETFHESMYIVGQSVECHDAGVWRKGIVKSLTPLKIFKGAGKNSLNIKYYCKGNQKYDQVRAYDTSTRWLLPPPVLSISSKKIQSMEVLIERKNMPKEVKVVNETTKGKAEEKLDSSLNPQEALIQRIAKMMQLGLASETPEVEAQRALRLAQRLLTKHQISEAIIMSELNDGVLKNSGSLVGGSVTVKICKIQTKEQQAVGAHFKHNFEGWMFKLANLVVDYFEVKKYQEKSEGTYTFYGILANVQMAALAFQMTFQRAHILSKEFTPSTGDFERAKANGTTNAKSKGSFTKNARADYRSGIVSGLREDVSRRKERRKQKRQRKMAMCKAQVKLLEDAIATGEEYVPLNKKSFNSLWCGSNGLSESSSTSSDDDPIAKISIDEDGFDNDFNNDRDRDDDEEWCASDLTDPSAMMKAEKIEQRKQLLTQKISRLEEKIVGEEKKTIAENQLVLHTEKIFVDVLESEGVKLSNVTKRKAKTTTFNYTAFKQGKDDASKIDLDKTKK